MKDPVLARAAAAGVVCAALAVALDATRLLWPLSMYWMLGSTGVAFAFGAAARNFLDGPGMYPRSMKAIARAAEDRSMPAVHRRTAVALYMYMVGLVFAAATFGTILLVTFIFFRQ
jgi:hypothetical protein